jgi:hypothetical protein
MIALANIALSLGGFLRSPVGKIVSVILLALTLWGGFQFWLSRHDAQIRAQAVVEFNLAQAEITEKIRKQYEARLQSTLDAQVALIEELTDEREALQRKADTLIRVIRSGDLQGGESSEVLRGTVQLLQERATGGGE